MVRLLHVADVHLGAPLPWLGEQGRAHRENIKRAFARALDAALAEGVHLVLIAGDLFDRNQPGRNLVEWVAGQLHRVTAKGVAVRILPGTHDRLQPGGVYGWSDLEEAGVRVYRGEGPGGWDVEPFPGLDLTVWARPTVERGGRYRALAGRPATPTKTAFNVGLIHAGLDLGAGGDEDYLVSEAEVAASALDYVAAGHWHARREFSAGATRAFYPGSPEPVSADPREPGVALLVDLERGRPPGVTPVPVGEIRVAGLELDLSVLAGPEEAAALIARQAGDRTVLRARIVGLRRAGWDLDPAALEETLASGFFHLRVEDRSAPEVPAPAGDDDRLIAGRFCRLLRERLEAAGTEPERRAAAEALRLGLALLDGREVW